MVAVAVLVPSTLLLMTPGMLDYRHLPGPMAVAWLILMIGVAGGLAGTVNSALCRARGWWPVLFALVMQWLAALILYPMVW